MRTKTSLFFEHWMGILTRFLVVIGVFFTPLAISLLITGTFLFGIIWWSVLLVTGVIAYLTFAADRDEA